jgi:hypothetical protein
MSEEQIKEIKETLKNNAAFNNVDLFVEAIRILEAVNDIGLTEIYVNLKNHDFDTCGSYKMDKKEAEKFVRVYKEIKGIDEA